MRIYKKAVVFALFCVLFINTGVSYAEDYQAALMRVTTLETTHDPDRRAQLTADGSTIHAEGFFKGAVIEDFYIVAPNLQNTRSEFRRNADGSFSASFSGVPSAGDGTSANAVLRFTDGTLFAYRVEYRNGWFFGDNGLAKSTMNAVENYYTVPPEISLIYVSATLNPVEIRETQDELRSIVNMVTAGLYDDYDKAKALNQWVADNIVYDKDARDYEVTEETVSIAQTLNLRRTVCIGIANTYAALLEAAGIKAVNIKGGIVSNADGVPYELLPEKTVVHEWVAFWYEAQERWVYADPTWDRHGVFENGIYTRMPSIIKYFDISPLALSFDHRGDRAELREYLHAEGGFTVPQESVGDDDPVVPQEPAGNDRATPPPAAPPGITPDVESDTLYYVIIGVMLIAAIGLTAVIIKTRK
jgi:transglutaminase-like putative cysteine protease